MQTLLVTGHSGFIGRNLIDQLSSKYNIIGFAKQKLSKSNILEIKGDIRKINSRKLPKNISCVIHLAAVADVEFCEKDPSTCIDINFNGTKQALELARKCDSNFLFLSTAHVFGRPKKNPIKENHPKNPTSVYAISKFCGEILCESFAKSYGLDVSIIRLFSIYGPYSPNYLVTAKIICQLLEKNKISLGNIQPRRDFLHVNDAISAIEIVLENMKNFNSYNVGFGKSYSIKQLYELIFKIAQKYVPVISKKTRKFDVREITANNSKIKTLGWKPSYSLEGGLAQTYQWYKKNRKSCI